MLEPQIAGAVQLGAFLAFGAPHLVDRPVHDPLDVEAVEGDAGLRERLPRPLHVRRRHVHAEVPDPPGAPTVRLEILPEQAHDRGVAPRRRVQKPRTVRVGEQRDVVVAPPARRLVHRHGAHRREVRLRPRLASAEGTLALSAADLDDLLAGRLELALYTADRPLGAVRLTLTPEG